MVWIMARKPAFITHTRDREAEIQSRLLSVLEARFRRRVRGEIASEMRRLLSVYEDAGFIAAQNDQHIDEIRALYLDMTRASVRTFGSRILTQGKEAGLVLETKIDFAAIFEAFAQLYVNQEAVRRRITSVAETTRKSIVDIVARGQLDGLSVLQIAQNIRDAIPGISAFRGALIARTETHGAANFGADRAARETGLDLRKEWVSVTDARTRRFSDGDEYNHLAMDGQTVDMDEPFQMPARGGQSIPCMFPGDPALPAAASINCRCAVAHTVVGFDD